MTIYYGDGTNSNGSSNGGRVVQTLILTNLELQVILDNLGRAT